ncbi:hypothetical protein LXM25_03535 [Dyadobacter sp. LJ53]|uniref:hypothetical protein n=1 Tax=Dyadobacter chenwenxiniae TaxID=2906456 RepID=UPI001F219CEE|nr:hypothetical protein [Dyadobacter chenwenxiniae]MCF0049116.1 hypothetical protein [Dyadobacter chenwenxiniae]
MDYTDYSLIETILSTSRYVCDAFWTHQGLQITAMKSTFLISSLSNRLPKMMVMIAIFTSTICLASPARAEDANRERQAAKKQPKSLEQQIRHFIQSEDTDAAVLESGIVVISFSVDENNHLSQVVSYSQIPAVDHYLTSHLEGKEVELPVERKGNQGKQYIKLRFTLGW